MDNITIGSQDNMKAARNEWDITEQKAVRTACIVIPTYNEAGNISKLLDQIYANAREQQAKGSMIELFVLVVDDSSPDNTSGIVMNYSKTNSRVHLLLRGQKQGLGAAYIAGMRHAMKILNPDVILEMDADFSHNPADIFNLLAQINNGADFVIGSRYIKGGSIPEHWGLHRRMISKAANIYTKIALRIPKVKDCSGGFRAIRSSLLQQINLVSLNVKGYAFQVLLLEAAVRAGAIIHEVPIAFLERNAGKSKMRLTDMIEGAVIIFRVGAFHLFSPRLVTKKVSRLEPQYYAASAGIEDIEKPSFYPVENARGTVSENETRPNQVRMNT